MDKDTKDIHKAYSTSQDKLLVLKYYINYEWTSEVTFDKLDVAYTDKPLKSLGLSTVRPSSEYSFPIFFRSEDDYDDNEEHAYRTTGDEEPKGIDNAIAFYVPTGIIDDVNAPQVVEVDDELPGARLLTYKDARVLMSKVPEGEIISPFISNNAPDIKIIQLSFDGIHTKMFILLPTAEKVKSYNTVLDMI